MGNIFNEIAGQSDVQTSETTAPVADNNSTEQQPVSDEINFDNLSNVAVGQQKKYVRPDLGGKTVKIKSAKLFNANKETDELITGMTNKETKYYKTSFLVTFDTQNADGVDDREYMSGVIQYLQKDGSISAPNIWYEGSRSQASALWVAVAKVKGVEPKELSPRAFMNYLNSEPSAKIENVEIDFQGKITKKNVVKEFIK